MLRFVSKSTFLTQRKFAFYSPPQICSSLRSLPSLRNNSVFSFSSGIDNDSSSSIRDSTRQNPYFAVKNLKKSSGFSHQFCIPSKSSENPNSVIRLFEESGFSQNQIRTIVSKRPRIQYSSSKILKPKIDFLHSVGISEADVVNMVIRDPSILARSLANHFIPSFGLLGTLLGGKQNAVNAIKSCPSILRHDVAKCLAPNVETMRIMGFPNSLVSIMVTRFTCSRITGNTKPQRFRNILSTLLEMGIDQLSPLFLRAVNVMGLQNELIWEGKFKLYGRMGFSDEEIVSMFKKQPISMCLSKKKIRAGVDFYFKKFHWRPSLLSKKPNVLTYSLEKRTIPRCSVLQVLVSRNKIHKNVKVLTFLPMTETDFLGKFVIRYKDEVPEVLDAYQGEVKFDEYTFHLE